MFGSSGWNGRFTIWTTAWVALEVAGGDDFFCFLCKNKLGPGNSAGDLFGIVSSRDPLKGLSDHF